jgi:hypothetical protein
MTGGEISGNTAGFTGGGVALLVSSQLFIKSGGIIYGYIAGNSNSNVVKESNGNVLDNRGHAIAIPHSSFFNKRRETTAGIGDNLDSRIDGVTGGWEN